MQAEGEAADRAAVFEDGTQARAVEAGGSGQAQDVEDGRDDVQVLGESVAAQPPQARPGAGEPQHEGGLQDRFIGEAPAVAEVAVVVQLLAMVRGENDERAIEEALLAQGVQEMRELLVEVGDLLVIQGGEVGEARRGEPVARVAVVEAAGDRPGLAAAGPGAHPALAQSGSGGDAPRVLRRRAVRRMRLHVVEIEGPGLPAVGGGAREPAR